MATKNNNGTWREQRHTLQPASSETIYFADTNPNHLLISNTAPAPLYVGVNGNVNPSSYDMVIPAYGTRLYARMMGSNRVYVFSDSVESVGVQITSWEGEFDPASIAQSTEMIGAGANGLLGIVEVNNLLAPLPTGTNVIGGVFIADFAKPLPTGSNNLGRVNIDEGNINVLALPQDGAKYKKVTATGASDIAVTDEKGFVYQVISGGETPVQLLDGAAAAWKAGDFKSDTPLICETSIKIRFTGAGDAYILYK